MSDGSAPGSQATHLLWAGEKCGFYGVNLCTFALLRKAHLQLLFFVTCNLLVVTKLQNTKSTRVKHSFISINYVCTTQTYTSAILC